MKKRIVVITMEEAIARICAIVAQAEQVAVCPHGETLGAWCVECPGEVAQAGHKTGAVA